MNESPPSAAPAARVKAVAGWTFAAFRAWKSREHPAAAYQIAPKFWRPEILAQVEGETSSKRQALKNWEPRCVGMAYSDRAVYLVEVVAELSAEHVGKLLYMSNLFGRDADYAEHRAKRVHRLMLVRAATPSLLDFARRHRVRVVVVGGEADATSSADGDRGNE